MRGHLMALGRDRACWPATRRRRRASPSLCRSCRTRAVRSCRSPRCLRWLQGVAKHQPVTPVIETRARPPGRPAGGRPRVAGTGVVRGHSGRLGRPFGVSVPPPHGLMTSGCARAKAVARRCHAGLRGIADGVRRPRNADRDRAGHVRRAQRLHPAADDRTARSVHQPDRHCRARGNGWRTDWVLGDPRSTARRSRWWRTRSRSSITSTTSMQTVVRPTAGGLAFGAAIELADGHRVRPGQLLQRQPVGADRGRHRRSRSSCTA